MARIISVSHPVDGDAGGSYCCCATYLHTAAGIIEASFLLWLFLFNLLNLAVAGYRQAGGRALHPPAKLLGREGRCTALQLHHLPQGLFFGDKGRNRLWVELASAQPEDLCPRLVER